MRRLLLLIAILAVLTGCEETLEQAATSIADADTPTNGGEMAQVTRVIDGDTIEVQIGDVGYRVRYVGINTPERDESCFVDATDANRTLVQGATVQLVRDTSNTDRYGRLLRYVYVGDVFVNEVLVRDGYAEVVRYDPDDQYFEHFRDLEAAAADQNLGCHTTSIFDDGTFTR